MAETEKAESESRTEPDDPEIDATSRDDQKVNDPSADSMDAIEGAGEEDTAGEENHHDVPDPAVIQRAARRSTIATAVVVALLGAAVNWPLRYVETDVTTASKLFVDFDPIDTDLPVMAGWPFRYSIHYTETQNLPALSVFSTSALLRNVGLILVVMAVVCVYVYRRGCVQPAKSMKRFRISIGDLLVLTFLVAVPFGFWQWLGRTDKQRQEIVAKLSREDGWVSQSAWIPEILIDRLPKSMIAKLRKIRGLRLENPSEPTVRLAMEVPTLTRFRIGGGDYDLRLLEPLGRSVYLRDLRISGREIDSDTIRLIASLNRLNTLNFMRTNVTTEALLALGALPDLRQLGVMHTEVNLAELGSPDWSDTITALTLPHPDSGGSSEVVIEGWPNLTAIMIAEYDTQLNPKPMKVRLADLPKLELVVLDQFQKFDLELSNLPALTKLEGALLNWESRLPRGGVVPGALWFEKFDGDGLPELSTLEMFCVDLKWFELRGPTKISSMGAGVFYRSLDQNVRNNPYERKLSPESATALIEGIGRSTGPIEIDLDSVPLAGVDLSSLANNKQLSRLFLGTSGTKVDQWRQFESMEWLTHLRLTGNEINTEVVKWALDAFPNLDTFEYGYDPMAQMRGGMTNFTFTVDGVEENLEFVGHNHLRTIKRAGSEFAFEQSVKIVDMPKLEMAVEVEWPQSIEIRNAPMLKGIAVSGPLPSRTSIDQQENLTFFAVGGPGVDDSVVESILGCDKLETLTLAYPNASAEILAKLPLAKLAAVFLPGSAIDDEVVQQWPALESVTHLNLADTKITAASLPKLLASDSLRSLTLDRCPIESNELTLIGEKESITELSVAGIGISADALANLLQKEKLQILDLSDWDVPNDVLDAIANNGSSIQHLSLRNSKFDGKRLVPVVNRHYAMMVDVEGSYLDTKLQIGLLNARRLKTKDEWLQQVLLNQRRQQQSQPAANSVGMMSWEHLSPSIIAIEDFASGGMYSPESMGVVEQAGTGMLGGPALIRVGNGGTPANGTTSGSWLGGVIGSFFGSGATDETTTEEQESVQEESERTEQPASSGDKENASSGQEE